MAEPVRLTFRRNAKGSGVTCVERLVMHPTLKQHLLAQLKKRLGCGGTVQDGVLQFQGDQRNALEKELAAQNYKVRRIG